MLNITIYGAGYVGLVTGVCFAEVGHNVLIIDTDPVKIAALSQGQCPIFEPSLPELLSKQILNNRLSFSTDSRLGVNHGLLQIIAVGTPSAEDGSANLNNVFAVAQNIGQYMNDYRIIISKSTVTIGTSQKIRHLIKDLLASRNIQTGFDVVSNPEFLRQGNAIEDFMQPDRVVLGLDEETALPYLKNLYHFIPASTSLIVMDTASAELTKYAANAYLATRISFINEMSQLAECFGADIDLIRQGIGTDRRIGHHFLYAGCGFGGSCFPKDVRALKHVAESTGYYPHLMHAVEGVNKHQKQILFEKISRYFAGDLQDKIIAVWGLSFKPNTDDMREAPSRVLIEALLAAGAKVQAFDPAANQIAQKLFNEHQNFSTYPTAYKALEGADVLSVVTEWEEFRKVDFDYIKDTLRYPAIFDGRNLYNQQILNQHGFKYFAVGRGDASMLGMKTSANMLDTVE